MWGTIVSKGPKLACTAEGPDLFFGSRGIKVIRRKKHSHPEENDFLNKSAQRFRTRERVRLIRDF